jgi:hypothetical protein
LFFGWGLVLFGGGEGVFFFFFFFFWSFERVSGKRNDEREKEKKRERQTKNNKRPTPSLTCKSICGFQSLSYSTTTSAVARLMPSPPARVDSRNTNCSLPGALNPSMAASRSSPPVLPSMRQYW